LTYDWDSQCIQDRDNRRPAFGNDWAGNRRFDFCTFLASSEKAVSFIPFIVDLSSEFGMIHEINFGNLSNVLLDNNVVTRRFRETPSKKLVKVSYSIF